MTVDKSEYASIKGSGGAGGDTDADRDVTINVMHFETIMKALPDRDFMADMLASITHSNAALATPSLQPTGVRILADRQIGLVGLPTPRDLAARPLDSLQVLREVLPRTFTKTEREGSTFYHFNVDALPLAIKPVGDGSGPPPHGGVLVQAEVAAACCALVLKLVDQSSQSQPVGLAGRHLELRSLIAARLEDVRAVIADPIGASPGQALGRFRRLLLAVADWLEDDGFAVADEVRKAAVSATVDRQLEIARDWRGPAGTGPVISTREDDLRVSTLIETLHELCRIVLNPRTDDVGTRGIELEQAMTLLCASAAQLRAELNRLGNSDDELELTLAGHGKITIAQFVAWVQDVCAAFATGDYEALRLRREEFAVYILDLTQLKDIAFALVQHAASYDVELRLIGARRQMKEVAFLLQRALTAAEALQKL